jgi:hypothetical protein
MPGLFVICGSEPLMNDRVIRDDERTPVRATETTNPLLDRRAEKLDRRKTTLKSVLFGALMPRRRAGRRARDLFFPVDWHDPYLLFLALVMLLLSVTDAFLTVTLLTDGGEETNPLLAFMLNRHPSLFAAVKMALTGFGIVVLVAVARVRLLGLISVRLLFQALVLAYLALVAYELWLVSLMA